MVVHKNIETLLENYTEQYLDRILENQTGSIEDFIKNYTKTNSIKK